LLASQTSSATGVDRIVLRLKFASDASSIGQPASRQQADFAPRSSPIDFGSSSFSRSQTAPRSRSLATGLPGSSRSPVEPVNGFWEQQSLPKLRISPGLATHEAMPWCIHRTDSQSRWRANHGRAKSKNGSHHVGPASDKLAKWTRLRSSRAWHGSSGFVRDGVLPKQSTYLGSLTSNEGQCNIFTRIVGHAQLCAVDICSASSLSFRARFES
jgi:hypothetical protein